MGWATILPTIGGKTQDSYTEFGNFFPVPALAFWYYNVAVAAPAPSKPVAEDKHRQRHSLYAAEASGLMVIAVLLLILSIVRYWQYINWSAR